MVTRYVYTFNCLSLFVYAPFFLPFLLSPLLPSLLSSMDCYQSLLLSDSRASAKRARSTSEREWGQAGVSDDEEKERGSSSFLFVVAHFRSAPFSLALPSLPPSLPSFIHLFLTRFSLSTSFLSFFQQDIVII